MANTHINVGGHKVTTGTQKGVTNVPLEDSRLTDGYVNYCIKNGWCHVDIYNLGPGSTIQTTVTVTTKLPKSMDWCHHQYSAARAVYLNPNPNDGYSTLSLAGTDPVNVYCNLNYPIADDSAIK